MREGKWHLVNWDFGIDRLLTDEELLTYLVDRYNSINEVTYVGPEVAKTNKLANMIGRAGQ